jgi:2-succinyl-6-hydroxy-2,4-cyclohexadiene-1-carboxylate synthase
VTSEISHALEHTLTGSGERIVLVHGFTQSGGSFEAIASELATTHEVCVVDLPGHGRSAQIVANDLVATAELLGAAGGDATYLGYSLGGRVCLTLAHARPDLVHRLVLVGASAGIADDDERAERRESDERLADHLDPEIGPSPTLQEFLDEWLAQPLFAGLTLEQQDRTSRLVNTPAGLARSLRTVGTGTQTPTHDRLAELKMPTLIIAGAEDRKFTAIGEEMVAAIGDNASLALIEDALHAAPFEQHERFVAIVRGWLALN